VNDLALISGQTAVDADEILLDTFNRTRDQLLGSLRRMLGNPEDAQDALQNAFLRCWQGRAAVPYVRNLRAWIWRVSLNAGRDLRDQVWRRRAKSLDAVEATACDAEESAADALVESEEKQRVSGALVHLRPEEREVFLMRQEKELPYVQIARQRGCPVGTAKTLMRMAVLKLRQTVGNN